jgi:MFS family permease
MRLVHGALFVSVLIWVDHTQSLSAKGYAIAIGISGVGTFLGTLLAPLLIQRFHRARSSRMVASFAVVACTSAWLVATRLTVLAMAFCAAISMQVLRVFADSVVQKSVDDRAIGRAYAAYDIASNAMFLIGGLMVLGVRSAAPRVPSTMWFVAAALGFLLLMLHSWTSDRPSREVSRAC